MYGQNNYFILHKEIGFCSDDYANQADEKIFFVKYQNQSDLKIFFVKYRNESAQQKNSKKHLSY